jgi:hypothetical protein
VRWRLVNSYLEAEIGALGHINERDTTLVPGLHAGLAVGFHALRQRWLIPGLAIGIGYDRTFARPGRPALELLKIGLRVTLDLDL